MVSGPKGGSKGRGDLRSQVCLCICDIYRSHITHECLIQDLAGVLPGGSGVSKSAMQTPSS